MPFSPSSIFATGHKLCHSRLLGRHCYVYAKSLAATLPIFTSSPAPSPLAQKRRPSAVALEPLKTGAASPTPARGGLASPASASAATSPKEDTALLLSNSLEAGMVHTLPQGTRTKLEHRGSLARHMQVMNHSQSGGALDPAAGSGG